MILTENIKYNAANEFIKNFSESLKKKKKKASTP